MSPIEYIPLGLIDPNPWQTREGERSIKDVEDLAHSIKKNGMMQTPTARRIGQRVQLAYGHTRHSAYRLLDSFGISEDYQKMPLEIKELDDEQMAIAAFEENEKRSNLNPVDRARAIQKRLIDFRWTQEQLAEKLHIDRSAVSNALRMLRLPADVLLMIRVGALPVRSALALLPLYEIPTGDEEKLKDIFGEQFTEFMDQAKNGRLNSDTIREMVASYLEAVNPQQMELPIAAETETAPTVIDSDTITAAEPSTDQAQISSANEAEQPPEIQDWGQVDAPEDGKDNEPNSQDGNGLEKKDIGNGVAAEEKAENIEPPVVESTQDKVTSAPTAEKPAEPKTEQADPNEITLSIKWQTAGVFVGYKKPNSAPAIRFLPHLLISQIPVALKEMGIE